MIAEESKPSIPKPFNIFESQYSQDTYSGRFMTLFSVQNPMNFFLPHKRIEEAKNLIDNEQRLQKQSSKIYNDYSEEKVKELIKSKNIVASAVHPETGEYIPRIMRMCAYAPMSIPTLFGFILSKPTTFNIIFWQWANQTLSAGMNYSNRSASSSLDNKGIAMAYSAAVSASIGVGLGMRKLLTPLSKRITGPGNLFVNFLISLAAVGSAGFINLLIMRSKEIKEGITLTDHEGVERGKSKIIGKSAVISTAFTRFLMPISPLLLPTLAFYQLEKKKMIPKNKLAKISLETVIFFLCLSISPPLSCALFRQTGIARTRTIEPEFQNLLDSQGNSVTELYYNKGI